MANRLALVEGYNDPDIFISDSNHGNFAYPRFQELDSRWTEDGEFHPQVFQKTRQPDLGGAHVYAFESYGLMETSPISPGVQARQSPMVRVTTKPSLVLGPAILLTGLPTMSGEIYGQNLLDANGNFVPSMGNDAPPESVAWNAVEQTPFEMATNDPFPMGF